MESIMATAKAKASKGYLNNPNLKQIGETIQFTQEMVIEYAKCAEDPIYYLENYAKVIVLGKGAQPFKLFPYQKRMIDAIMTSSKIIGKIGRQMGKSQIVAGYFAWYVQFGGDDTKSAILANKLAVAKEIFSRVQFIIENTPKWLQQGVKEWNKTSLTLENGSTVFCSATSPSAVRGFSLDRIFCDEFAHLSSNLAEEFIASVFPTLSSSQTSKLIIVSTPKGMNHFYRLFVEAEQGINGFTFVTAHWSENPNRDDKWYAGQLRELGKVKTDQEVNCSFIGSSFSLIDGKKISELPMLKGNQLFPDYIEYFPPDKSKSYVITVDTSRGSDLDYSAFPVIDISTMPYKVVAVYRNNAISSLVYPEVIYRAGKRYNDAFVLIESNDLGQQVADILFYDLEYENVYMSVKDKVKEGGGSKKSPGLRTTKRTKAIGCSQLKDLIENDQLEVNDPEIISELSTFIRKGASYAADEGKHDDLAMCLVMFGYLVQEPIFKDLFDFSLRDMMIKNQLKELDDILDPIGFFDRGDDFMITSSSNYNPNGWIENTTDEWNF